MFPGETNNKCGQNQQYFKSGVNQKLELLGSTIHSYFTLQGDYQNVEAYNLISRMCEIIKKTIQNH